MNIPILTRWMERRSSLGKFDEYMDYLIEGGTGKAGVNVTEKTALNSTAVLACVRILSETIASLPLPIYRRVDGGGKTRAPEHPLYKILHDAPNPYMTAFNFKETLMGHLATWGNAYAEKVINGRGQVEQLWPLRPDKMVEIKYEKGRLIYVYRLPDGTDKIFSSEKVLHIAGLGFDGIVGYSPIRMAREAVGLAMATEDFGGRFFKNGARPGGVLEHPQKLREEGRESLRKSWNEMHQGLNNQHRIAILEEGMKYTQIGIPPGDAQFLQTRKFQIEEISRIYRVPLHMLSDLTHATFSNIEHQSIDFVVHTIRPWLVRWEQAIKQKLFLENDKDTYFAEFLIDGLLRGDTQSRFEAYNKGFQIGAYSVNEILANENRNPIGPEGDQRFVPMNMIPLDQAKEIPEVKEEERSLPEKRANTAAINRSILAKRFEPVIYDAAARLVKGEAADIRRSVRKRLKDGDSVDFLTWMDDYYKKMPERIKRTMAPVFTTFAELIQAQASSEVGAEPGMTDELKQFMDDYTDTFATRYIISSERQIKALIRDAPARRDIDPADPAGEVEERLDEWEEKRAGKVAMNETVQCSNAVTRAVFIAAGVVSFKWAAIGSDTCPMCEEMDGRVVGREQPFFGAGDNLDRDNGRFTLNRNIKHPPLHQGCVCQIVPG